MVKPRVYRGRAVRAKFHKTQTGKLAFEVEFQIQDLEPKKNLKWRGWLTKPEAIERTMDTMVNTLGFSGNDTCDEAGYLLDERAIDFEREVSLTVDIQEYQGKDYNNISWVNPLRSPVFEGEHAMRSELDSLNLKAAFLAAKQKAPAITAPVNPPTSFAPSDEPIPF